MARNLRAWQGRDNGKVEAETPLGNLYAGYLKNYPLALGGTMSDAWAGLGDYEARVNRYDRPGQNPEFAAGMNFPDSVNLPNYYGEADTPLGKLFGGTNDGNPNINVGFQPNDRAVDYVNAVKRALESASEAAIAPTMLGALARTAAGGASPVMGQPVNNGAAAGALQALENGVPQKIEPMPRHQIPPELEAAIKERMLERYRNRGFTPSGQTSQPSGVNLGNKGYPSSWGAPSMRVTR